jgi:hypothetical protein
MGSSWFSLFFFLIVMAKALEASLVGELSVLRRTNAAEKDVWESFSQTSRAAQINARGNLGSLPAATAAQEINRGT